VSKDENKFIYLYLYSCTNLLDFGWRFVKTKNQS